MIIYKYLDQKGAEKTIKKNSVLLRTPDKYNDPFDCLYYSTKEEKDKAFDLYMNYQCFVEFYNLLIVNPNKVTKNQLLAKIQRPHLKAIAQDISKEKAYKYDKEIATYYQLYKVLFKKNEGGLRKAFDKIIDSVFEKIKQSLLVACFSLKNDSILMWSHYADNHKGACIEFEIDDDKYFKPVYCKKDVPNFQLTKLLEYMLGSDFLKKELDYDDESLLFAVEPLLTKSEDWHYEQEIRCAFSIKKRDKRIFDYRKKTLLKMPKIKRIILGCKSDKDFVNKIKGISGDIPIQKMGMVKGKYKLVIEKL